MVKVGSRIEMESEKVGVEPRAGVVTAVHGAQVQVHWDDGHETSIIPAAGAMRVIDQGKRARS
jgi:acyl dehydratase